MTSSSSTVVQTESPMPTLVLRLADRNTPNMREAITISYQNCNEGIGIKVIGGVDGIYVNKLLPRGLARKDGRLIVGDQIQKANGCSLEGIDYTEALAVLRSASASNKVTLVVLRDTQAQTGFQAAQRTLNERCEATDSSRVSTPDLSQASKFRLTNHVKINGQRMVRNQLTQPQPGQRSAPVNDTQYLSQVSSITVSNSALPSHPPLQTSSPIQEVSMSSSFLPSTDVLPSSSAVNGTHLETHLALDPSVPIRVDKLERALGYLGLSLTPRQQEKLRSHLRVDEKGHVAYGDFVEVTKQLFHKELANNQKMREMRNMTLKLPNMNTPRYDESTTVPPLSLSPMIKDSTVNSFLNYQSSGMGSSLTNDERITLARLKSDNEDLRRKTQALQMKLDAESQRLAHMKQDLATEVKRGQEVTQALDASRNRANLAEAALKSAQSAEMDYEQVVQGLELRLEELSRQEEQDLESPTVRKKLALLACQLQKVTESQTTYQVTTQRLLSFAEDVYDAMTESAGDAEMSVNCKKVAKKALDCITAIHAMVEDLPLPFGWEKAFTKDGIRYYLNHLTQETTWHHPSSKVSHILPQK